LQVRRERAQDGEALIQGGVLFHQLVDVRGHVLLLHHEDQVLLVGLQDDSEQEQGSGLLVGDSSISKHVSLLIDQEISTRKHDELRVHLRSTLSLHEDRVENGNSLQSEWEALTERKEFNVNLTVLDVEFAEVSDVVSDHFLKELGFDKLVFEGVFVGPA